MMMMVVVVMWTWIRRMTMLKWKWKVVTYTSWVEMVSLVRCLMFNTSTCSLAIPTTITSICHSTLTGMVLFSGLSDSSGMSFPNRTNKDSAREMIPVTRGWRCRTWNDVFQMWLATRHCSCWSVSKDTVSVLLIQECTVPAPLWTCVSMKMMLARLLRCYGAHDSVSVHNQSSLETRCSSGMARHCR